MKSRYITLIYFIFGGISLFFPCLCTISSYDLVCNCFLQTFCLQVVYFSNLWCLNTFRTAFRKETQNPINHVNLNYFMIFNLHELRMVFIRADRLSFRPIWWKPKKFTRTQISYLRSFIMYLHSTNLNLHYSCIIVPPSNISLTRKNFFLSKRRCSIYSQYIFYDVQSFWCASRNIYTYLHPIHLWPSNMPRWSY